MKIIVVGGGNIFKSIHLPVFKQLGWSVVAVVEPSPAVIEQLKVLLDPSTVYYDSLQNASFENIDIALISSPTAFHYTQAKFLSQIPLHVFCEKPMAVNSSEAKELAELFSRTGKAFQIGFYRRFHSSSLFIKNAIQDKRFGKLIRVSAKCGWVAKNLPESILNKSMSGGGITLDYGIHIIDRLLSWCDNVEVGNYQDDNMGGIEINSSMTLQMKFSSGHSAEAILNLSWTNPLGNNIQLYFERATINMGLNNPNRLEVIHHRGQQQDVRNVFHQESITFNDINPFVSQWVEFEKAIVGEKSAVSSIANAIRATEIVETCYSIRTSLNLPWGN